MTPPAVIEKLTPRKLRHRKLAQAVLQGKSMREIGEEVYPNANNPAQTVYNCLAYPGPQAAIAEQMEKSDYNKADIRRIISLVLQSAETNAREGKLTSSQAKVLEIASRTEAMLTDKQEQTTRTLSRDIDTSKMSTEELTAALIERLRASAAGVETVTMAEVEAIPNK
jgi:hypothetical protein